MTESKDRQIKDTITDIVNGNRDDYNSLLHYGPAVLPILADYLTQDLHIDGLERAERILKIILRTYLNEDVSGQEARDLALFQKKIGFLFKYKSYAIKASSPLGYSIFTQQPGEGFSFQQHKSYKTEVFHILEVHQGGYVFICSYEDWTKCYEKDAFTKWLQGHPDDRYDRFRIVPEPGDVFLIDQLNVVHAVIGCILEEYATLSVDMVDRLHNQNQGKPIPDDYNRNYAQELVRSISFPKKSRLVSVNPDNQSVSQIIPVKIPGGYLTQLAAHPVYASRYLVEPFSETHCQYDDRCAISLYVSHGQGRVIIGESEEVKKTTPPSIKVSRGDLLMIPRGIYYAFVNEGSESLELSEHKIPFAVAFDKTLF